MTNEKLNKLKTVSGAELLDMDLPPMRFVVKDLIPQGLHLVAGLPKVGKSWMLLLLCLKVAKGEPFWEYETEQGTALYLCLEDSFNRIQQRLGDLTDDAPANLHFAIMAGSLADGLLPQIEQFLSEHPDTNLIVIDTLQKVREGTTENCYAGDYKDVGLLKSFADQRGITILCVQHLRKQYNSDPHLMVSGSTGLTGSADGSYVLQKKEINSTEGKLFIRGRDIEEKVLTLHFNRETCEWEYVDGDTPAKDAMENDPAMQSLISYLQTEKEFQGQASELVERLQLTIRGNVLARKLNRYEKELQDIGIEFIKSRTGQKRELLLVYSPPKAA
ncbi:MAG: AAA family ATPase [Acutalibacter sp.]|nr:AAA family ATPase [Acutalibacter sp.]